jgi:hypothetical protein
MRLHLAPAVMAGSITLSAFLFGCNTTVTTSIAPPAGCAEDNSLDCRKGSTGFSCTAGTNPEDVDSSLSCSIGVANGANDDYCCFTFRTGTTCSPDDNVTLGCAPGSYGYSCAAGDDPTSLDSTLNCSTPTANGPDDDFCCQ